MSIPNSSLQQSLTNSIRRVKQKIYNHSHSTQQQHSSQNCGRPPSQPHREENHALAAAMKKLQSRITQLEKQNKNLVQQRQPKHQNNTDQELLSLLQSKEDQIQTSKVAIQRLRSEKLVVEEKVFKYEEELAASKRSNAQLQLQLDSLQRESQPQLTNKNKRINELEQAVEELSPRHEISHPTMQKMMVELSQQKERNKRWLKWQAEQLTEQKENNTSQINRNNTESKQNIEQPKEKANGRALKSEGRKDYSQLLRNNKEMYETIQRNKLKIVDLIRELKESEEKYMKLKLLVHEIVDNVNKVIPHSTTHIRFLIQRIDKLDHTHLESLRSFSQYSRKSGSRRSNSNDKRRSLKMEDLSNSAKKSHERSEGKSNRKSKKMELHSHSQKKKRVISNQQIAIEQLEKEIITLKRQYRNLIVRQKPCQSEAIKNKIEQTSSQIDLKQGQLKQLKSKIQQIQAQPLF